MHRCNFYSAIFFVWFCTQPCKASTVIYIVTPAGIIIGADGRKGNVAKTDGVCGAPIPNRDRATKVFLLKHRFALASVGLVRETAQNGNMLYDLPTWAASLKNKVNKDMTVEEFSLLVKDESTKALAYATGDIKKRLCKLWIDKDSGSVLLMYNGDVFTQFVTAGYERGVSVINTVTFKIDWEHNTAAPVRATIEPREGQQIDSRIDGFGYQEVLSQVCNPKSDRYKKAVSKFPSLCQAIEDRQFTLKEASDTARKLIGIEVEVHPNAVGLPITVVTIPRHGRGRVKRYEELIPPENRRYKEK